MDPYARIDLGVPRLRFGMSRPSTHIIRVQVPFPRGSDVSGFLKPVLRELVVVDSLGGSAPFEDKHLNGADIDHNCEFLIAVEGSNGLGSFFV